MNLAILHLSDVHISCSDASILSKAKAIKSAIQPRLQPGSLLLTVYTGDLAYSGAANEYAIAARFVDEVSANLNSIAGVQTLRAVAIPGNHDCDFSAAGDARPVLISSVATNLGAIDVGGESIQQLLKVQSKFFDFEQKLSGEETTSRLGWTRSFTQDNKLILIRCLNTALFSRLHEAAGQLALPLNALPAPQAEADFALTLMHHPYGWLAPDNARELRRRIESNSDLILTGHEHEGDSYTRVSRTGDETGYVEGAALAGSPETGFNLILVNLEASTCQIFPFKWQGDIYEPTPPDARIFTRKQSLIESRFDNNPEFVAQLHDMGTGFSHPDKEELTLRDLFVYPELRLASVSSKSQPTIQSWNVLPFVAERDYVHIAGAPISGKSTLARALYLDLQNGQGLVPLLLNGREIRSSSQREFDGVVQRAFGRQYRLSLLERFRQLDQKRKVLLIDDWHRSRLSGKAKRKVLELARAHFGKVVLFSDDVSLFQLLADVSEDGGASEAEYCEIKQFGYRLRSELVRKWHSIEADGVDDLELTWLC
jgi:predicted MPP superfamily phosphohydrolase